MAVDVEHSGQRQRCGVNVSSEKVGNDDVKKGNKGEGKKSKPTAEKSPSAPEADVKDEEMKDANAETGEQTSNADTPMEVDTLVFHLCHTYFVAAP